MRRTTVILSASSLLLIGWFASTFLSTRDSIRTDRVDAPFTLSARAPAGIILGSGGMYLLYQGTLDGKAILDVVSNNGRAKHQILLEAGEIGGIYGSAEEWVGDIQVHYTPVSAKKGTIYAVIYCGDGMNKDDWNLFQELQERPISTHILR